LRFEKNIYFTGPGQGWFSWGPTWARHATYSSLGEFQAGLGIDNGSHCVDPGFSNFFQLDFRVSAETMTLLKSCYPTGQVPTVLLGLK
jgi:hypothetical protein